MTRLVGELTEFPHKAWDAQFEAVKRSFEHSKFMVAHRDSINFETFAREDLHFFWLNFKVCSFRTKITCKNYFIQQFHSREFL